VQLKKVYEEIHTQRLTRFTQQFHPVLQSFTSGGQGHRPASNLNRAPPRRSKIGWTGSYLRGSLPCSQVTAPHIDFLWVDNAGPRIVARQIVRIASVGKGEIPCHHPQERYQGATLFGGRFLLVFLVRLPELGQLVISLFEGAAVGMIILVCINNPYDLLVQGPLPGRYIGPDVFQPRHRMNFQSSGNRKEGSEVPQLIEFLTQLDKLFHGLRAISSSDDYLCGHPIRDLIEPNRDGGYIGAVYFFVGFAKCQFVKLRRPDLLE